MTSSRKQTFVIKLNADQEKQYGNSQHFLNAFTQQRKSEMKGALSPKQLDNLKIFQDKKNSLCVADKASSVRQKSLFSSANKSPDQQPIAQGAPTIKLDKSQDQMSTLGESGNKNRNNTQSKFQGSQLLNASYSNHQEPICKSPQSRWRANRESRGSWLNQSSNLDLTTFSNKEQPEKNLQRNLCNNQLRQVWQKDSQDKRGVTQLESKALNSEMQQNRPMSKEISEIRGNSYFQIRQRSRQGNPQASQFSPNLNASSKCSPKFEGKKPLKEEDFWIIKKENEQLVDLNRTLVSQLDVYECKDNLKEQEYIINHQYNEALIPHQLKYIFQQKQKYLTSQKKKFDEELESIKMDHQDKLDNLRLSFATEIDQLYQIISSLSRELCEAKKVQKKEQTVQTVDAIYSNIEQERLLHSSYQQNQKLSMDLEELREKFYLQNAEQINLKKQLREVSRELNDKNIELENVNEDLHNYERTYQNIDIKSIHQENRFLATKNEFLVNVNCKLEEQVERYKSKISKLSKEIQMQKTFIRGTTEMTIEKFEHFFKEKGQERDSSSDKLEQSFEIETLRPDFEEKIQKCKKGQFCVGPLFE